MRTNVNKVKFARCDEIAENLPLSKEYRPGWDAFALSRLGFTDMRILSMDTEDYVCDTIFGQMHTPMSFGLCARLPYSNVVLNLDKQKDALDQVQDLIDDAVEDLNSTWKVLSNRDCVRLLLTLYTVNITTKQAAEILGCSYSLAAHDLKILIDSGFVDVEKIDGEKVYKLKNRQAINDLYALTYHVNCSHNTEDLRGYWYEFLDNYPDINFLNKNIRNL